MTATVAPVLSLYAGFGVHNPMLVMNVDKGTLVYNQSQKHPYKLEFMKMMRCISNRTPILTGVPVQIFSML